MIQSVEDLERDLHLIPEPTYVFKVGDKVTIGNLEDEVIKEVHFGGKGYTVEYTGTDYNYGKPISTKGMLNFWIWVDIRKRNNNKESLIQNGDIILNYSQRDIHAIFGMMYSAGLDMDPYYQRDYVWSSEDKINLIDSIFKNVDIGKFVINKPPYEENKPYYAVIDGKQRISTICDFYEDRFKYKGKFYSDLSYQDKGHFRHYTISFAEVSRASKKDVLKIFIMINTTGKIMDTDHLNKIKKLYNKVV